MSEFEDTPEVIGTFENEKKRRNFFPRLLLGIQIIVCVVVLVLAAVGANTVNNWQKYGGLKPVETVRIENIDSIFVYVDDDGFADHQVVVESSTAAVDIVTGKVTLSVIGEVQSP
jgi:hypothetical protein